MKKLPDNIKLLTLESDACFIKRSCALLDSLNEKLKPFAKVLLEELDESVPCRQTSILYIPVVHFNQFNLYEEEKIERDLFAVLTRKNTIHDLYAIGETINGAYTKQNRTKQISEILTKLAEVGVISKELMDQQSILINSMNGFERALFKFTSKHAVNAVGVESLEGVIITTALESEMVFAQYFPDTCQSEILYRMGIEGRTRIALNRAVKKLGQAKRIVFIQGALHLESVKAWCARNAAKLQIIIPQAVYDSY